MTIPEGGGTPNTPEAEHTSDAALEHVEDATKEVAQAAVKAPTDAMHEVLLSVKDVLVGVQAELKRSNDRQAESTATQTVQTVTEPAVEITDPPKVKRKVRRFGRVVERD